MVKDPKRNPKTSLPFKQQMLIELGAAFVLFGIYPILIAICWFFIALTLGSVWGAIWIRKEEQNARKS